MPAATVQNSILLSHSDQALEEIFFRALVRAGFSVKRKPSNTSLEEALKATNLRLVACDARLLPKFQESVRKSPDPLVSTVSFVGLARSKDELATVDTSSCPNWISPESSILEVLKAAQASASKFVQFTDIRVLVVDDSAAGRKILEHVLDSVGAKHASCASGLQATELLKNSTQDFDAVLTDLIMPEMSGEELCRWIRMEEKFKDVPVICVSGNRDAAQIASIFASGGTDYIGKDLINDELLPRLMVHIRARRLRDSLIKRHLELIEAQRKIEDFLAVCSHDMKTPLAVIKLESKILKNKFPDDPYISTGCTRRIEKNVDFISQLIENIIDSAKGVNKAIERDSLSLQPMFESLVESFGPLAEKKGLDFQSNFCIAEDLKILSNEFALRRILSNLLSNAIKFSKRGGKVTFLADYQDTFVVFSVRDEGAGIPQQHREEIFERFSKHSSRGTEGERGTGLGLFLSRRLAWALEGNLTVESEEGAGSAFYLKLPVPEQGLMSAA
jgi:two-component system sensor histidine kinase/response regulator